jgi:hypothetical protein
MSEWKIHTITYTVEHASRGCTRTRIYGSIDFSLVMHHSGFLAMFEFDLIRRCDGTQKPQRINYCCNVTIQRRFHRSMMMVVGSWAHKMAERALLNAIRMDH